MRAESVTGPAPRPADAGPAGVPLPKAPLTWLVLGEKGGDNRQVEIIAEQLAWPVLRRNVISKPEWAFAKPRVRPRLSIFDPEKSDRLEPPWPDLILTVGRRPSSAALWIKKQSGDRARIVLIGKPAGSIRPYDLVVASSEHFLPRLPIVLPIGLPLMRVDPEVIAGEAADWAPRLEGLPRPWVAFLLGGPTRRFRFDERVIERVLEHAGDVAHAQGGTPFVLTSRRTPPAVVEVLRARLPAAARLHVWGDTVAGNPYAALLKLADAALVTLDSISMLTEAARQGLPLGVIPLSPAAGDILDRCRRAFVLRLLDSRLNGLAVMLAQLGVPMQSRDFEAFEAMLVARGLASHDTSRPATPTGSADDELRRVVERIEALFRRPARPDAGRSPCE